MPVVRFTHDFPWKPRPAVTTIYKAGSDRMVTTACAAKAVAKGKGEIVKKQRRKKTDE